MILALQYFLRVPLSMIFPTGVVLVSLIMFVEVVRSSGELDEFMKNRMAHYFRFDHYDSMFAREAWDGIQSTVIFSQTKNKCF